MFKGTGDVLIPVDTDTNLSFSGHGGNIDDSLTTLAGGTVTVTYQYTASDLAITKTDNVGGTFNSTTNNTTGGSIVPGQDNTVVYTIVASNSGPDTAVGQTVTDSDLTSIPGWVSDSWTAVASGSSTVTTASGSGNISDTVTLVPGAANVVTFTVTAHIKPDASATAAVSNTATVSTPAGDTTPADNTSTDTLTLSPQADLAIQKTDNKGGTFNSTTNNTTGGSIVPGQDNTVVYTIVVSNSGPSTAVGQTVTDSDLTSIPGWVSDSWTAVASGSSTVTTASGSGNISDTVTLVPGAANVVTFTVTAHIKPDASATAAVSNTATVSTPAGDTTPADNTSTDTLTLSPQADLAIQKTDNKGGTFNSTTNNTTGGSIVPGQDNTVVYTIVVSNSGPSTAVGQTVTDSDLTSIPGWVSDSWTAVASGSSTVTTASGSGNISDTVTLVPGAANVVTFTVTAHIKPDASATAAVSNTATVSTPAGDTTPADNTSTDTLTLSPQADLAIQKTDNKGGTFNSTTNNTTGGSIVPGQDNTVVYTIVVSNSGPSTAVGQTVTDSDLTSIPGWVSDSWTAVASGSSTVTTASGSGNISDTVTLVPGAANVVTFTVTAHIKPDASATAAVSNTATVSTPAGDTTPADNTSTDTLTLSPQADLAIQKTDNKGGTFNSTTNNTTGGSIVPGQDNTVVYTIVVSNSGPSTAVGQTVTDSDLTSIPGWVSDSWTAVASGSSTVTTASGSGNISDTVTLVPGAANVVTFTVTAHIKPDASATAAVSNTATVSTPAGDTTPADNTSTDTLTLSPQADLAIQKTDNKGGTFNSTTNNTTGGSIVPGQDNTVVYTIVVSNSGPSTAVGQTVTDSDLTSIPGWVSDSWTAVASGSSTVTTASGSGNISDTVTLVPGAANVVTFTVTAHIKPDASATAAVSNTATVSTPAGDTTPADNTSTDTLTLSPLADVRIQKTDNVGGVFNPTTNNTDGGQITSGQDNTVVYTILVTNDGPSTAVNQTVTDSTLTAISTSDTWTATASSGSSVTTASGSGNISDTVTMLPGGTVTFIVTATIHPASGSTTPVVNTASVTLPNGDTTPTDNTSTDTIKVSSSQQVGPGEFATIGFWHNNNGQAVINSFNNGPTDTKLGNWLASNFPMLFGASNPYTSTSLAGKTNAQVATIYANLWTPSGVTKNTYVQAFAVALGAYADTIGLGFNSTAMKYGFKPVPGGGLSLTYNIGSNGAAFGVPNNTTLTVSQILTIVNNNFNPSTGLFYGGNQTLTSEANNVLDGINSTGDIS